MGGDLILRIEDTDQARSTLASEKMIREDIARLGIKFSEGPDEGGSYGPYRQSERMKIYDQYAVALWDRDQAYPCFCKEEELTRKRDIALKLGKSPQYDRTCAGISRSEAMKRLEAGEDAGLRFRALSRDIVLRDHVRGEVRFPAGTVGDFFITRTPRPDEKALGLRTGMPVYNFCCAIDDALMKITHVIRGDDHLSNTSRQLMIYEGLGFELPEFAHISMVLGMDRQKLSKRNGDSSVHDYLGRGILPEALLNFLSLLGFWPNQDTKFRSAHPEVIAMDELVEVFDFSGLQKSPAVFDTQKLYWMNGFYLRALSLQDLQARVKAYGAGLPEFQPLLELSEEKLTWILEGTRNEAVTLQDFVRLSEVFLKSELSVDESTRKALGETAQFRTNALRVGEALEKWLSQGGADFELVQKALMAETTLKGKDFFQAFRVAVTGRTQGPEVKKILQVLGREAALGRVRTLRNELQSLA
jgi:glutamyl-tRNA synthetase